MAARRTRTPRLPPEIRRRQILDATLRAIDADGFVNLTIDSVAREAGITRPVVYELFGDLEGLLDAFLDDAERQALDGVGGALPDPNSDVPADQLLARGMRTFLEAVRAEPEIWRIILLPPEGTPPSLRGRVGRRRAEIGAGLAELVEVVIDRQGLLPGVDPPALGRIIVAIGEDMGRLILERPRSFTPSRIERALGGIARLITRSSDPAAGGGGP